MSDIGPGDLVVCVDAKPTLGRATGLVEGRSYKIRGIARFTGGLLIFGPCALNEAYGAGWGIARFRKIDAADEQFTRTVRACGKVDA